MATSNAESALDTLIGRRSDAAKLDGGRHLIDADTSDERLGGILLALEWSVSTRKVFTAALLDVQEGRSV